MCTISACCLSLYVVISSNRHKRLTLAYLFFFRFFCLITLASSFLCITGKKSFVWNELEIFISVAVWPQIYCKQHGSHYNCMSNLRLKQALISIYSNKCCLKSPWSSWLECLLSFIACNVLYINSVEMESLTGPQAIAKAISETLAGASPPTAAVVHFKVSSQGITLTDNQRK